MPGSKVTAFIQNRIFRKVETFFFPCGRGQRDATPETEPEIGPNQLETSVT